MPGPASGSPLLLEAGAIRAGAGAATTEAVGTDDGLVGTFPEATFPESTFPEGT